MTRRTARALPADLNTCSTQPARSSHGAARRAALLALSLAAAATLALTGCGKGADTGASADSGSSASCDGAESAAGLKITLKVSPCPIKGGKTGTATITVADSSGKPVTDAEVDVNSEMPDMKMKGSGQKATAEGDTYRSKLVLGMPGDWKVKVNVSTAGKKAATTFHVHAK